MKFLYLDTMVVNYLLRDLDEPLLINPLEAEEPVFRMDTELQQRVRDRLRLEVAAGSLRVQLSQTMATARSCPQRTPIRHPLS